jgi:hypothetical protein
LHFGFGSPVGNEEVLQLKSLDARLDRIDHPLVRDPHLLDTAFNGSAPAPEFVELIAATYELAHVKRGQPSSRCPSKPANERGPKASVHHFKGGLHKRRFNRELLTQGLQNESVSHRIGRSRSLRNRVGRRLKVMNH